MSLTRFICLLDFFLISLTCDQWKLIDQQCYNHTNNINFSNIFMSTSRTAISLDSELLKQTDKIAKNTGNSRSGVIAIALSKYLQELNQTFY